MGLLEVHASPDRKTKHIIQVAKADVFDYIERFHNPRMRRRVAKRDQQFSSLSQPSVKTG